MTAGGAAHRSRTGRRDEVLVMLRDSAAPLSIAEVAERLGVHPNTARFHLDVLVEGGRVEEVHLAPSGPGRPPRAFRARPGMDPAGPRNYRLLAGILADSLAARPNAATRATEAGRAWGTRMVARARARTQRPARTRTRKPSVRRAVADVVDLLDELGFAPERPVASPAREIGLRHCPFLELVETRPQVVCHVHLGLMQGALAAMDAPVTVGRLVPFHEPDRCLAHLERIPS